MRTAIIRGLRPTCLLLDVQPHSEWNAMDRALLLAYQVYEDEMDRSSGSPIWLTRSLDPAIVFDEETRIDYAAKATEDWDHEHPKDKARGTKRFAVPMNALTGEPLVYGGLTREQQIKLSASQVERDAEPDELEGLVERRRPVGGYDPTKYGDGVTSPA